MKVSSELGSFRAAPARREAGRRPAFPFGSVGRIVPIVGPRAFSFSLSTETGADCAAGAGSGYSPDCAVVVPCTARTPDRMLPAIGTLRKEDTRASEHKPLAPSLAAGLIPLKCPAPSSIHRGASSGAANWTGGD